MSPTSTSYSDKLTRLGNQLDSVDTKIAEFQAKRETIVAEIQNVISLATGVKTALSSGKRGMPGDMGERIVSFLQTNNGATNEAIAARLKVTPNRTGLSLYHLTQKNRVYQNDGKFYIQSQASGPAAITD